MTDPPAGLLPRPWLFALIASVVLTAVASLGSRYPVAFAYTQEASHRTLITGPQTPFDALDRADGR